MVLRSFKVSHIDIPEIMCMLFFYFKDINIRLTNMSSKSPLYGNANGGTIAYDFQCPQGSYVTKIDGRTGELVDNVTLTCGTGKTQSLGQSTGGNKFDTILGPFPNIRGGTDNLPGTGDQVLSAIEGQGRLSHQGQSDNPFAYTCPPDQKISGAYGKYGTFVDNIGFYCSPLLAPLPPTQTPSAQTQTALPDFLTQNMMMIIAIIIVLLLVWYYSGHKKSITEAATHQQGYSPWVVQQQPLMMRQ